MKNLTVFLIKTAVLFLVFWLISTLTKDSAGFAQLPDWSVWLILAAVASAFDYVIDVLIKKDSPIANYTQYVIPNRA